MKSANKNASKPFSRKNMVFLLVPLISAKTGGLSIFSQVSKRLAFCLRKKSRFPALFDHSFESRPPSPQTVWEVVVFNRIPGNGRKVYLGSGLGVDVGSRGVGLSLVQGIYVNSCLRSVFLRMPFFGRAWNSVSLGLPQGSPWLFSGCPSPLGFQSVFLGVFLGLLVSLGCGAGTSKTRPCLYMATLFGSLMKWVASPRLSIFRNSEKGALKKHPFERIFGD